MQGLSLDGKLYRILEFADKRVKQTDKFETGDKVRVDTEKVKYVDRVTGKRM